MALTRGELTRGDRLSVPIGGAGPTSDAHLATCSDSEEFGVAGISGYFGGARDPTAAQRFWADKPGCLSASALTRSNQILFHSFQVKNICWCIVIATFLVEFCQTFALRSVILSLNMFILNLTRWNYIYYIIFVPYGGIFWTCQKYKISKRNLIKILNFFFFRKWLITNCLFVFSVFWVRFYFHVPNKQL